MAQKVILPMRDIKTLFGVLEQHISDQVSRVEAKKDNYDRILDIKHSTEILQFLSAELNGYKRDWTAFEYSDEDYEYLSNLLQTEPVFEGKCRHDLEVQAYRRKRLFSQFVNDTDEGDAYYMQLKEKYDLPDFVGQRR